MRAELITTIMAAIFGVLIAYFVCNLFVGEIQPVSVKEIDSDVSASLNDPDPEIFNYKALNPTVEVYVGSCAEYNEAGECIDQVTEEDLDEIIDQDIVDALEESQESTNDQKDNVNQGSSSQGDSTTNQDSSTNQNAGNNQGNR